MACGRFQISAHTMYGGSRHAAFRVVMWTGPPYDKTYLQHFIIISPFPNFIEFALHLDVLTHCP